MWIFDAVYFLFFILLNDSQKFLRNLVITKAVIVSYLKIFWSGTQDRLKLKITITSLFVLVLYKAQIALRAIITFDLIPVL